MICTTEGVAAFFETYGTREITPDRLVAEDRLVLDGAAVWLMHEHPPDERPFTHPDIGRAAAKFEHLRQKLFGLRDKKRRTFVLCQADNNLTVHYMWGQGRMDFAFSRARLNRIQTALDRAFPEGLNRLVVIGLQGRLQKVDWSYPTLAFAPDNSEWQGDDRQWDAAVETIAAAPTRWPYLPASWPRAAVAIAETPRKLSICAGDERLQTLVGRRSDGLLRLEGGAGCGLFGPYVRLQRGFYEASIRFAGAIAGSASMDVACGLSTVVLAHRRVVAGALSGREARLRVALDRDSVNVEIRLWCEDGFMGEIESVSAERLTP